MVAVKAALGETISEKHQQSLASLLTLPAYSALLDHITANSKNWIKFFESPEPENALPLGWTSVTEEPLVSLHVMLLLYVLRPDRFISQVEHVVETVFGKNFPWQGEGDISQVVEKESSASAPLLLCSRAGGSPRSPFNSLYF